MQDAVSWCHLITTDRPQWLHNPMSSFHIYIHIVSPWAQDEYLLCRRGVKTSSTLGVWSWLRLAMIRMVHKPRLLAPAVYIVPAPPGSTTISRALVFIYPIYSTIAELSEYLLCYADSHPPTHPPGSGSALTYAYASPFSDEEIMWHQISKFSGNVTQHGIRASPQDCVGQEQMPSANTRLLVRFIGNKIKF